MRTALKRWRYLVVASVVLGAYTMLALVVSLRVASAPQLESVVKVAVWGLLWGFVCYGVWLFVRYYRRL